MTNNAKTPQIRFKGFTDAWEQRKLGDIAQITMGQSPDGATYTDTPSDHILVQGNADLENGWVKPRIWTTQITKKADAGDLIMSVRAPAGAMGKTAYNVVLGRGVAGIKGNNFLFQILVKMDVNGFWKKLSCGSTFESLNSDNIKNAEIKTTGKDEQQKIGTFFSSLDNLITLHQRKLEKLKNVKKSLLEKMFPKTGSVFPEIRFKGFTDAWEQRKLGETVSFYSGLTYSPNNIVLRDGTLVLRSSNVKDGEIFLNDNVVVKKEIVNSDNVQEGDIIVVVRNGSRALIGKHAKIKKKMDNTVIGAFMTGVRYQHPDFLNSLLNTEKFNHEINKDLGATINQITTSSFKNMEFKFPVIQEEQQKIGTFFSSLDNLITLHQRKLEKLKNVKKSLLEKMFV